MEHKTEDAIMRMLEVAQGAADILRALANADDVSKEALRVVAECLDDGADGLREIVEL